MRWPTLAVHPLPRLPTPARARKLHRGHFAFMRSVVQGLDVRDSWERYFLVDGEATDQRLVRSTIAWIRDEFAAAAKRHDRHGTARLFRLDLATLAESGPDLSSIPTLEEFAEAQGLADERQADQIAAYEEAYGDQTQRQSRKARLIARQLEALHWLEGLVAQDPQAGDAIAAWLQPSLARHLEAEDLFTLAQLVERINGIGKRWYAGIRSVGEGKARRIVQWLQEHQDSLKLKVGAHVAIPRQSLYRHELQALVPAATAVRPLEKFQVPRELDGSQGLYRRPQAQCLLKASNDYQAILAWLKAKQGLSPEAKADLIARRRHKDLGVESDLDWLQTLSHTQRAYRKEAERFLLWAILHQRKALSSMTNEDCAAYRDFLADPQPRSRWCGERGRERWSPLWRPFEGPLSPSAQRHALTILKNLYGFLVEQNYLMGNPWGSVRVPRVSGPKLNTGRSFSRAQWSFIEERLALLGSGAAGGTGAGTGAGDAAGDAGSPTSSDLRLRFALHLLYATGLRLSEAVAAKVDDLQWVEYPPEVGTGPGGQAGDDEPVQGWLLKVIGKGDKLREVPVPTSVIAELAAYLVSRGLDADPEHPVNREVFLIGKAVDAPSRAPGLRAGQVVDPRQGVAASTLYEQIKVFFADCASHLRLMGDERGAERFAKASTHWMRHSHASHAIAAGMPIEIAQQNLGHASLATTTAYVSTEQRRRMKAVQGVWGK